MPTTNIQIVSWTHARCLQQTPVVIHVTTKTHRIHQNDLFSKKHICTSSVLPLVSTTLKPRDLIRHWGGRLCSVLRGYHWLQREDLRPHMPLLSRISKNMEQQSSSFFVQSSTETSGAKKTRSDHRKCSKLLRHIDRHTQCGNKSISSLHTTSVHQRMEWFYGGLQEAPMQVSWSGCVP